MKYIIFLILFFISLEAFSQFERKTWLIGSSGFINNSYSKYETNYFNTTPQQTVSTSTFTFSYIIHIGYFIYDRLLIGYHENNILNYRMIKNIYDPSPTYGYKSGKYLTFNSVGCISARYYFPIKNFFVASEIGYMILYGRNISALSLGINLGYLLTNKISLELSLNQGIYYSNQNYDNLSTTIVSLGVNFYLKLIKEIKK